MKRQTNIQQVKKWDKCPPNQTKEEEIENLPDKEFQIMIVKMIQNLENKMASQINSLETRIEKMQERFNKDLEEIKGFPGGSEVKASACNVGDLGSIPGLGRCAEEGNSCPLRYSGLENSMICIVHGVAKSWTRLSNFHFPLVSALDKE